MAILHLGPLSAGAVLTGLEKSHYHQLTSSAEIIDFMGALASGSDAAQSIILTRSASGYPLGALLIASDLRQFTTGGQASDKLTVMLIGSQHGNESSGAEALMIVCREVLEGKLRFHL